MGECSGKTGLSEETSARMFGVFEEREEQGVGSFVPLETLDFLRERRRQRRRTQSLESEEPLIGGDNNNNDDDDNSDNERSDVDTDELATRKAWRWWPFRTRVEAPQSREIRLRWDDTEHCEVSTLPQEAHEFAANVVRNQKYSVLSFVPKILYEQFRFAMNLFFLGVALSQVAPFLRIGPLITYIAPLTVVLLATMLRELFDDVARYRRDKELNETPCTRLNQGVESTTAAELQVGDLLLLRRGERVPADVVIVWCDDPRGRIFVRTDQLDGETDWKRRRPVSHLQTALSTYGESNFRCLDRNEICRRARFFAADQQEVQQRSDANDDAGVVFDVEAPRKHIYDFGGTCTLTFDGRVIRAPISLENTVWMGCTVASSAHAIGLVVYTGKDTRLAMNGASQPPTKVGVLDLEVNRLAKVLLLLMALTAAALMLGRVLVKGDEGWQVATGGAAQFVVYLLRFVILLSSIIPISLRVNLDLGKAVYAWLVARDSEAPEMHVRSSTIPEELGRVAFLLSDKTGTLTRNHMRFRRLVTGLQQYTDVDTTDADTDGAIRATDGAGVTDGVSAAATDGFSTATDGDDTRLTRALLADSRKGDAVFCLSLCHQVSLRAEHGDLPPDQGVGTKFESSSPDEIALVRFAVDCGLRLSARDDDFCELTWHGLGHMPPFGMLLERHRRLWRRTVQSLQSHDGAFGEGCRRVLLALAKARFEMPVTIPFSSVTRCSAVLIQDARLLRLRDLCCDMGVADVADELVRESEEDLVSYTLILKGAESSVSPLLRPHASHAWLHEECDNLARQGLRTLTVAARTVSSEEVQEYLRQARDAAGVVDSAARERFLWQLARRLLCHSLHLVAVTGVDDRLQEGVPETLEMLRHAGIRIWMLTGDKVETACCIARSASLVSRSQRFCRLLLEPTKSLLTQLSNVDPLAALVVDGHTLAVCLERYRREFAEVAMRAPCVIVCRASPLQKAQVARLLKSLVGERQRIAAIGDGGNDVPLIQAAHVGIGIRGKEGRQAALAADFVLRDGGFGDLARLVLWHGRLAYWRSARLTQFVMHRGLIIAVMQAVFSALFQFAAVPLFTGWLLVGYSTVYTCLPVFSLVLDEDVDWATVAMFPQLYDEHSAHMRHTPLSLFTFGVWVFKSVYQGCTIMLLSLLLFDDRFLSLVAIAFTVLVLTELMNVALFLQHWTRANVFAEAASLATYLASMFLLKEQFDVVFILSADFWWKVAIITCASCLPVSIGQFLRRKCAPPVHTKLRDRSELV